MKKYIALLLAALLLCAAALAEDIPDTSRVADASEMTDVEDIVPEGMTPVTADMLNDGVYQVNVDSSSSMFKIAACDLVVADGELTAILHMNSEAYSYMYPGAAGEASQAAYEDLRKLEPTEAGDLAFVLPVDALDAAYTCAAFSARKQAWYPRTLLFRADSLPAAAWKNLATAESLGLADGEYAVDVVLAGKGKAALASPAKLTVADGVATADIVFSTKKIDYVIVDGGKFEPVSVDEGAAFTVPVAAFDTALSIIVDSTAISPATEVSYTMTFDSASIAR